MTTRRNLLDRTEIASPCNADWNAMKGTDQIRYCSECHKYVYNLSEMTRREAEALLASRRSRMCARLIRDLSGQTLTVESLAPVKLLGRKPGPVATAVVSAMISIAPPAAPLAIAQVSSQASHSGDASTHKPKRSAAGSVTSAIAGIVYDQDNTPMSGAIVTLTSESTGDVLSQLTSDQGEFRFEGLQARTYIVEARFPGYRVATHHDVILQQGEAQRFDVAMDKLIIMNGVSFTPPQPLRTLYLNSDRVVIAQVGESTAEGKEGSSRLLKTSLTVSRTIKGDGHKPAIDVYEWVYGKQVHFTKGETVLAFLQRGDESEGRSVRDGYTLVSGAESAKHLSESALETYVLRLDELKPAINNSKSNPADIIEWLVRCAEDPVTRREGAFELSASVWREKRLENLIAASAPGFENVATMRKSPRDEEPIFVALLTSDQKERLMKALLESEELTEGAFDLIELARHWNDPRLLPFLVSYLRRVEESAPEPSQRVMQLVTELIDDQTVNALFDHYVENASYEDSEDIDDESDEDDDDVEADEEASEQVAGEDSNTNEPTDDDTPELTPEAAKQARVQMLKKFLEAVDSKLKLAAGK